MRFSLAIISAFFLAAQVSAGKTEPTQLQIGKHIPALFSRFQRL